MFSARTMFYIRTCIFSILQPQQRLDGTALIHRLVAFGHLVERKRQIEDLAGIDLPLEYEVDQLRQIAPHGSGTAMQMDMREEQLLAVQFDAARGADIGGVAALARGMDRLQHRLLRADAFQHAVRADAARHLHDAGHTLVAAFGYDVGRTELAGEFLPYLMTAHRDDPFGAHLFGRLHGHLADRAVPDSIL